MNAPHPITRPTLRPERFRYPVHRDYFCASKPIAVFDTWGEAADYAMANDLFMGEPMRRAG